MIHTKVLVLPKVSLILNQCEESMNFRLRDNQPALFHLNSGGNRARAKFCIEAGIALHLPVNSIVALACTIELLHNASLIHDDLQDSETMRRGRLAVWKKYGKSHAICAGDVMISAAYGALADIGNHPALPILLRQTHQAVSTTIKGQSQDLDAANPDIIKPSTTDFDTIGIETIKSVSVKEYEKIAAMKSGPLIELTLCLPLLMADKEQHVATAQHALQKFAVAYQIIDDLGDWQQDLQQNNLNLINLLVLRCDTDDAILIAQTRAQDLLQQCEKELALLPDYCADSVIKATQALLVKTKAHVYE